MFSSEMEEISDDHGEISDKLKLTEKFSLIY